MKKGFFYILMAFATLSCGRSHTASTQSDAVNTDTTAVQEDSQDMTEEADVNAYDVEAVKADIEAQVRDKLSGALELQRIFQMNDNSYYGLINIVCEYDPNANINNGHNGIDPDMRSITGRYYVIFDTKIDNGKVVVTNQGIEVEEVNLPGVLGESAEIWSAESGRQKVKELTGQEVDIKMIDVDGDDIFEALAYAFDSDEEGVNTVSTYLLTLGTSDGKVGGVDDICLVMNCGNTYYPLQVDIEKHQVFWRGGVGMGSVLEKCYDIEKSHATTYYEYVKETNPDNTEESSEDCYMQSLTDEDDEGPISLENYRSYCSHSSMVYTLNAGH